MTRLIRDLTNDMHMPADSAAGILESGGAYWFAGGRGFEAILDGEPWDAVNTPDDWAESHPSLEAATEAADAAMDANEY